MGSLFHPPVSPRFCLVLHLRVRMGCLGGKMWNACEEYEDTMLFQASSQGPPVPAVVYAAAGWWLSTVRPAPLWLFSEFDAVYSDLLTYCGWYIGFQCRVTRVVQQKRQLNGCCVVVAEGLMYRQQDGFVADHGCKSIDGFLRPDCRPVWSTTSWNDVDQRTQHRQLGVT